MKQDADLDFRMFFFKLEVLNCGQYQLPWNNTTDNGSKMITFDLCVYDLVYYSSRLRFGALW